ncbi:hypothetical protein SRS16CHR_00450 [Variovorax sp. SRS16]|uniref:DUF2889 domain-containing protein n=1 Tax=Variovorax sp. SRS16 TaxID=282217 RepID=UPI00131808FD|nr:DUF2889 domain-containing protein [Variovorax sp. SRS16]VTU13210.1 hypothetical protein SRS16CHR_00450 [Variovorax sp. SRS16]
MTELPHSVARELIHTRQVTTCGYLRADDLWDIEGELVDTKTYPFTNPDGRHREPGQSVHHMRVRLTLDDRMTVREAVAAMTETPFPECPAAEPPLAALVGASCSAGWRKAVEEAMGDVRGCTHVRELLYAIATVAFQTIMPYRNMQKRREGVPVYAQDKPGPHMGQCLAWDFDGSLIARRFPQFVGWRK